MAGDLLPKLQQMDDYEFEHLVADLWERSGFDTQVVQQSGDKGIDVRAVDPESSTKHLIQAKRYGPNTTVGGPDVQQYGALQLQEDGVDDVFVVTTNGFSSQAKELGDDMDVSLVNGEGLVELIENSNAQDIVAEYIPSVPTPEHAILIDVFGQETLDRISRDAGGAEQQANASVPIHPEEAQELGVAAEFIQNNDEPSPYEELGDQKYMLRMVIETDDLHLREDGTRFVEDITEYVPESELGIVADPPIMGVIATGASKGAWKQTPAERAGRAHYGIILGMAMVFVLPLLATLWPVSDTVSGAIISLGFVGGGALILLFLLFDLTSIQKLEIEWEPSHTSYLFGLLFLGASVPIYLYQRWKHVGL